MTSWTPETVSPRGPMYIAIADAIAADVRSGRLRAGDRMPTHRALAQHLGVNVVTITRAYGEAARRGLVEGEVGRGTFVRLAAPEGSDFFTPVAEEAGLVDFHHGVPAGNPELVDERALFRALGEAPDAARFDTGYSPTGFAEHREAAAEWMGRTGGLAADRERVLVTGGAQQALSVALTSHAEPGDLVLTEELTYPGIKALAGLLRLRTQGVALDEHGLRPDAFEEACRRANARLLYCMPNAHNPLGVVSPVERRREIAEVARRYGVTILEDDTHGFYCPEPPPPIASFAPEETIFVSSTSKSVAPGLRIGFLHAPTRAAHERMVASLTALAWMAPPLMAEIASRWIRDGTADALVAWRRDEAAARREVFDRHFGADASPSLRTCTYVWLPLPEPWRCEEFAARARRRGVAVSPADYFVVGRASAPHAVRLAIGRPRTREEVEEGLAVLAGLLRASPGVGRAIV